MALEFFGQQEVWESVWRGHRIAALAAPDQAEIARHKESARTAWSRLKELWPKDFDGYSKREDIRKLTKDIDF